MHFKTKNTEINIEKYMKINTEKPKSIPTMVWFYTAQLA